GITTGGAMTSSALGIAIAGAIITPFKIWEINTRTQAYVAERNAEVVRLQNYIRQQRQRLASIQPGYSPYRGQLDPKNRYFAALVLLHNAFVKNRRLWSRPLSAEYKDQLRTEARELWFAVTGRRAIWDELQVHHRIPLEWSHIFKEDPNAIKNLYG